MTITHILDGAERAQGWRPATMTSSSPPGDVDRISVVICAYTMDRWDDLQRAVRSVLDQDRQAYELILVIDHSPELYRAALGAFGGMTVIENAQVQGLSGARNSGIVRATGEIVAFLDDDAEAEAGWLRRLAAWYADPGVIAVGGRSEPVWHTERPTWFPAEFDWVVGCTYRGLPEEAAEVRNMIGSNMSFRRDVFAVVGGFNPDVGRVGTTPVGCEETEFCIRASERFPGSRIMFDPEAGVRHHLPASRSTWRYFRQRCYAEGRSKAIVAASVGSRRGLASERRYTTRTLPRGAGRAILDAIRERRVAPLGRAAAIAAGLGLTATGYAAGLNERRTRRPPKLAAPDAVVEVAE